MRHLLIILLFASCAKQDFYIKQSCEVLGTYKGFICSESGSECEEIFVVVSYGSEGRFSISIEAHLLNNRTVPDSRYLSPIYGCDEGKFAEVDLSNDGSLWGYFFKSVGRNSDNIKLIIIDGIDGTALEDRKTFIGYKQ